jgi:hypothetical protein
MGIGQWVQHIQDGVFILVAHELADVLLVPSHRLMSLQVLELF